MLTSWGDSTQISDTKGCLGAVSHAWLGRTPSGLCEPQARWDPQPVTAKWVDSEDSPHTGSPFPRKRMRPPNWNQGWEGSRRGPHARPRARGTSRSRPSAPPPGKGHLAGGPRRPRGERPSVRAGPGQTQARLRQRRGQREKEGHSPASARALTAPEVVTRPLPGWGSGGDVKLPYWVDAWRRGRKHTPTRGFDSAHYFGAFPRAAKIPRGLHLEPRSELRRSHWLSLPIRPRSEPAGCDCIWSPVGRLAMWWQKIKVATIYWRVT